LKDKLRIGLIGCGAAAERCHLPALLARADVRVTAGVDENPERARVLATKARARACTAIAEALPLFEAAIVTLPNTLHAPASLELLRAGKHVLVEKPMAVTATECAAMIGTAEQKGVTLAVGHMRRFQPAVAFARRILQSGWLGRILKFDVREGWPFGWPAASDYFLRRDRAGGGVLIDTGAHTLDTLLWWLGDVARFEYADDAFGGVEADCRMELELVSGARGTVELSRTRRMRNSAILCGEAGWMEVWFYAPRLEVHFHDSGEVFAPVFGRTHDRSEDVFAGLFSDQLEAWLAAIRGERPPAVDGVAGARVVSLIERLYAARKPLKLPWFDAAQKPSSPASEVGG
jgi:predicted dehydrogenase